MNPEIVELDSAPDREAASELERFWISYFRFIGIPLANSTDGGEACYAQEDSVRQKISERAKERFSNPEYRKAHAERAKESHPRGEDHPRFGKGMPKHVQDALLKANVGRQKTPEETQKRSDSLKAYYAANPLPSSKVAMRCAVCGTEVLIFPSRAEKFKACSLSCASKYGRSLSNKA